MRAVYLILVGVLWFVLPLNVFGQCMTENTISREKIIPHKTVWLSDKDISDELTIPNESMDIPYDDIQSVIDEGVYSEYNRVLVKIDSALQIIKKYKPTP